MYNAIDNRYKIIYNIREMCLHDTKISQRERVLYENHVY